MSLRTRSPSIAAIAAVGSLVLTGCSVTTPEAVEEERLGCLVSAPAGFDDHSAGALTLEETELARGAGVFSGTSSQRVSGGSATSAALDRMHGQDCALTAVIGPGGADELSTFAAAHPDDLFLGVSSGTDDLPKNVLSMDFDLVPPAFIAGYTAATASETGKVGVVVARGFPQSERLLRAFDAGVDLYNKEKDEDLPKAESYRPSSGGAASANGVPRAIDDTRDAGKDYFEQSFDADVDVLVPFGSAAATGVITAADEKRMKMNTVTEVDEDEKAPRPKIVWYGTAGGFSKAIVATVEPNVRRGLRTMFPDWPQSKNPDEVAPAPKTEPEEIGGFRVADRHYWGTLDNGGVRIVAEDGFLSRVSDAGRGITDLRERIKSGEIDPAKG
ncbi:BMP family ABC transporter substrate-binding protein [Brevibacterium sp. JSBI002]|uniref:BMP family ABC transporter substrate-binding protein n=1 Tax=Brevibacterium sp. JSBI002 TaxID=2886045 RepID=UPI002230CCCE|nr:BMP family ABC transporter substrate-binding protein [Brevibacterium sp. JSBI002]UZD61409.1 BMP family ABC transporter substrate-binding protein [Brevibacterium sp. JSBI002]